MGQKPIKSKRNYSNEYEEIKYVNEEAIKNAKKMNGKEQIQFCFCFNKIYTLLSELSN